MLAIPIFLLAYTNEDVSVGEKPEATSTSQQTVEEQVAVVEEPDIVKLKTSNETNKLKELSPIELVNYFCDKYNVDKTTAKAIIKCESGDRRTDLDTIEEYQRTIKNSSGQSTASGYAQFLDGTWKNTMSRMGLPPTTDKHDYVYSIEAFVWLLSEDGTVHWNASKSCWINYITK